MGQAPDVRPVLAYLTAGRRRSGLTSALVVGLLWAFILCHVLVPVVMLVWFWR